MCACQVLRPARFSYAAPWKSALPEGRDGPSWPGGKSSLWWGPQQWGTAPCPLAVVSVARNGGSDNVSMWLSPGCAGKMSFSELLPSPDSPFTVPPLACPCEPVWGTKCTQFTTTVNNWCDRLVGCGLQSCSVGSPDVSGIEWRCFLHQI